MIDKVLRILKYITIIVCVSATYKFFSSDFKGNIKVWERSPEGKLTILHVRGEKKAPHINLNLLGVNYDTRGNKTFSYSRRVKSIAGFDTYAGISYQHSKEGHQYFGVQFTLGF